MLTTSIVVCRPESPRKEALRPRDMENRAMDPLGGDRTGAQGLLPDASCPHPPTPAPHIFFPLNSPCHDSRASRAGRRSPGCEPRTVRAGITRNGLYKEAAGEAVGGSQAPLGPGVPQAARSACPGRWLFALYIRRGSCLDTTRKRIVEGDNATTAFVLGSRARVIFRSRRR
jgi:hypothetical protein